MNKPEWMKEIEERVGRATDTTTEVLEIGNLITLRMPVPDWQIVNNARVDIPRLLSKVNKAYEALEISKKGIDKFVEACVLGNMNGLAVDLTHISDMP